MDRYNPELPTIEVYAENYNIEGIRDSEGETCAGGKSGLHSE